MKTQVNVRLTEEEVKEIDALRIKISQLNGEIPTRSDVVRKAIKNYVKSYGSGQNQNKEEIRE